MINWTPGLDGQSCSVLTDLIRMRVNVDMKNTRTTDAMRYVARVETINLQTLRECDDISSLPLACGWCEQVYAQILEEELARVRG